MPSEMTVSKIAMIGCGSMGGGMALLFAEHGIEVSLQDPSEDNVNSVLEKAKKDGLSAKLSKHNDYASLCTSLAHPKVLFWSLPHGSVGDTVLEGLEPYLQKGDIVVDCGNEHWQNTERRQGKCVTKGIRYVGCGVSGGYQAARRGPSMCPGSDDETLNLILPTLRKVAAKAPDGSPCVGAVGTGGAGHYCKMIHNGIEHGMMSVIAEAYSIMRKSLGLSPDTIAEVFDEWNRSGVLKNTFLVQIAADICRATRNNGQGTEASIRVLDEVEDKVVQDFTGEEGTGIWSNTESIEHHVPAPTLTTAHFMRLASGHLDERRRIAEIFGNQTKSDKSHKSAEKHEITEHLSSFKGAVYVGCLTAFVQGMHVINKANKSNKFNINFRELMQVWRGGCIIQSDHIVDELLTPYYEQEGGQELHDNLLLWPRIANEIKDRVPALKHTVVSAVQDDQIIPSLSATLEYIKYMKSTDLPTAFSEAQLDYFGSHMFDAKGDDPDGKPVTGKHHYEWKPA